MACDVHVGRALPAPPHGQWMTATDSLDSGYRREFWEKPVIERDFARNRIARIGQCNIKRDGILRVKTGSDANKLTTLLMSSPEPMSNAKLSAVSATTSA
jgi:hypothetical protein